MTTRYGSSQRRKSIREFWQIQQGRQQPADDEIIPLTKDDILYSRRVLFTFSTAELSKTHRVQFFYSLKGRGRTAGIIEKCDGIHLAPGCIVIPPRFAGQMERFLDSFTSTYERLDVWVRQPSRKLRLRRAFEDQ